MTLRRSSAGYGMKVKPVVIRSAPTSGPLVSGTYTMLEVAGVDAAGVAAAGGVLPGDILLKVCGISVQSGGAQALMAAMATATASEGDAEWRFMRLRNAAVGAGATATGAASLLLAPSACESFSAARPLPCVLIHAACAGGDTLDRKRMAAVLRAYQERAATLVQAQWRGLQGRKQMPEHLEHGATRSSLPPRRESSRAVSHSTLNGWAGTLRPVLQKPRLWSSGFQNLRWPPLIPPAMSASRSGRSLSLRSLCGIAVPSQSSPGGAVSRRARDTGSSSRTRQSA